MEGKLPSSLSKLTQLRMIELATMNSLCGSIPNELCSITTLKRLCICRCAIKGPIPQRIGDLTNLEELQLFGNSISGTIPTSISKLQKLRLLSLGEYTGGNLFVPGPLPDALSHLTALEALFMANCNVKGTLPSWLSSMQELRQLDLQHNQIYGSIPSTISSCQNLLYLNLKDNIYLAGPLPTESLARLTKLNRLSLVHCSFTNANQSSEELKRALPRCKIWL